MNADDLARKLRIDGAALSEMPLADKVNLSHEPRHDRDGPIDGEIMLAVARAEVDAEAPRLAEPPEREVLSATVDGNFVTARSALHGVLVDGTPIDYETEAVFEVTDGVIVGIHARFDHAAAEQHRMVLTAGRFESPRSART